MNKEDEKKWCKKKDCPAANWQKPTPATRQKPKPVANMSAKPKVAVAGNLLKNGNCEGNVGTWGTTTNWFCNICVASRFTGDKHEGSSSIKISGQKAIWAGINYNLDNQISDGGFYHLIGWIKICRYRRYLIKSLSLQRLKDLVSQNIDNNFQKLFMATHGQN